jgi:hypothetical protein
MPHSISGEVSMAEAPKFDPVAQWQQLVAQWERQVNDLSAKFSGSEEFAGPMNQAAKLSFAARKSMDDAMEKLAQSMHLATHVQMQSVLERLDRIEEQLQTITTALTPDQSNSGTRVAEPKRNRRPPEGQA